MKKLWIQNNAITNPYGGLESQKVVYTENSPGNNFDDMSSDMEVWDTTFILDWSRRRDEIAVLFYTIAGNDLSTYGNLTANQKLLGAKYFLVPYSLRVTNSIVTEEQDAINWQNLLEKTKQSRLDCIEAMRIHVGQYIRTGALTLAQTQTFFKDVFQLIEWFKEANLPDFKQWITNEAGSVYENDGFAQKGYYSSGLRDELLAIYNGEY